MPPLNIFSFSLRANWWLWFKSIAYKACLAQWSQKIFCKVFLHVVFLELSSNKCEILWNEKSPMNISWKLSDPERAGGDEERGCFWENMVSLAAPLRASQTQMCTVHCSPNSTPFIHYNTILNQRKFLQLQALDPNVQSTVAVQTPKFVFDNSYILHHKVHFCEWNWEAHFVSDFYLRKWCWSRARGGRNLV